MNSKKKLYQNPVLDEDFADPSVIAADQLYYAYGTRSYDPERETLIQVSQSSDMVTWDLLGNALAKKPDWAQKTNEFWAAHVAKIRGQYVMFFSTQPDNELGMGIGVATSETPVGPFVDSGKPVLVGETFTTIDPMIFQDPQTDHNYLLWGSGHGPIWIHQLTETGLDFAENTQPVSLIETSDAPYENLVEGSYLIFHEGWYYLFYSGDNVWKEGRYAVMIARSKQVLGPYEKRRNKDGNVDNVILQSNKVWDAPGQNSLIQDKAGSWWTIYHAVNLSKRLHPNTNDLRRVMLLDKVIFEDGWPKIGTGTPSINPQSAPVI